MVNNPADGQVGLCEHLSSAGCSGQGCRQRAGGAVAGFRNWSQENVKMRV